MAARKAKPVQHTQTAGKATSAPTVRAANSGVAFVLYDDAVARTFEPFALSRPVGELRAGAALIRHRWQTATRGGRCTGFVGAAHLASFQEFDAPPAITGAIPAGTWLVNARCAIALKALTLGANVGSIRVNGRLAAVKLTTPLDASVLADGQRTLESLAATGDRVDADGWWLDAVWDLVGHLVPMLTADIAARMPRARRTGALTVVGRGAVHVESGADVEPFVVADTTSGPVYVAAGAHVLAFTRLVGPCIVDAGATIMGGRVAACSIGPMAKVNGEISNTIVIGHANKGHDGFVGHSVIGRWANLGAGTITSNLKNSYGEVALWTPAGVRPTGLTFLGSLIGDHAKLGIGTRLTTGCVVGAGANVFGTRMPPKVVPPFAWGDGEPWETFKLDEFVKVAVRVLARRQVPASDGLKACWRAMFAARGHARWSA